MTPTSPLFHLEKIYYSYGPNHPVLRNVHFFLYPGEKVALTGPNGAGKTTLFHLLVGLITPQQGHITAFGKVRRVEKDFLEVRARAGLLFQDSDDQLFCPTVREDVAFGPLNLGKTAHEVEAIVTETLGKLGLETYASRITHRLSGGEKRLVALATVLAMEPDVLLLDEPTNGLDRQAEARLMDILSTLPQAMIIISHHDAFLDRIATRHMVLDNQELHPVVRKEQSS